MRLITVILPYYAFVVSNRLNKISQLNEHGNEQRKKPYTLSNSHSFSLFIAHKKVLLLVVIADKRTN